MLPDAFEQVARSLRKPHYENRHSPGLIVQEKHATTPAAPQALVVAAFLAIYLIWGSTYLAIRFAVETMPPFLMGGARFLLAGSLLYGFLRMRGAQVPSSSHWINAIIVGALLLGIGNGAVNWAGQRVPSSVVALIVAVTPLWFALLDWVRPGGVRPRFQVLAGIMIGFGGMTLLVGTAEGMQRGEALDRMAVLAVVVASIAWASGSLYARYTPKPDAPLMGVALQMLAGGVMLSAAGVLAGESDYFSINLVSARSAAAFLYLVIFGSLIGFTAYSWLLKVSTPARISTYAYVNPVVAVFLGWAMAGEILTGRMIAAAGVILLGVIVITTDRLFAAKEQRNGKSEV
jgi:drug/metabolite transporter (DMT)-like permease